MAAGLGEMILEHATGQLAPRKPAVSPSDLTPSRSATDGCRRVANGLTAHGLDGFGIGQLNDFGRLQLGRSQERTGIIRIPAIGFLAGDGGGCIGESQHCLVGQGAGYLKSGAISKPGHIVHVEAGWARK